MNKNNNFIYHFAIFLFSSIGIFLTYRMHVLHSANQNCGVEGDCLEAFNSFSILGFSNIDLGILYYTTLTIFGLISLFSNKTINKKIIIARNSMIIFGFIYSLYLVLYLILSDIGFCELCLYSACICTILFISVIKSGFRNTSVQVKGKAKYLYLTSISIIISLIIFSNPVENKIQIAPTAKKIPIAESVVLGNPNAKVTITEFTDFQWRHCANSISLIDEILKKYPNDVKIVIKHSPLNFHKQAYKAAQYALAAHKQGKYKEMSDSIFANYTKLKNNENLPIEIADSLGLDMDKFIADSKSDKIKKQIDHEISQFMNSGFERKSVPKFLIQGKEVSGNRDIKTFSRIIDLELNK